MEGRRKKADADACWTGSKGLELRSCAGRSFLRSTNFFFNFFNNILISTRIDFYLQRVARLIAPLALTWPPCRATCTVAPYGLARQGQCPGSAPASSPPPSLSFPHSSPIRPPPGRRRRPPPPPPQIRHLGGSGGNVPHPSPKVLLPFFPPLTMYICRY